VFPLRNSKKALSSLYLLSLALSVFAGCAQNSDGTEVDAAKARDVVDSRTGSDGSGMLDATAFDEHCGQLPSQGCRCISYAEPLGDPVNDPSDICHNKPLLVASAGIECTLCDEGGFVSYYVRIANFGGVAALGEVVIQVYETSSTSLAPIPGNTEELNEIGTVSVTVALQPGEVSELVQLPTTHGYTVVRLDMGDMNSCSETETNEWRFNAIEVFC
jgi:hypothetical protein